MELPGGPVAGGPVALPGGPVGRWRSPVAGGPVALPGGPDTIEPGPVLTMAPAPVATV